MWYAWQGTDEKTCLEQQKHAICNALGLWAGANSYHKTISTIFLDEWQPYPHSTSCYTAHNNAPWKSPVPNLYLTVLHCFKKPNGNTTMTITIPTEEHLGVKHLKSYWSFGERREKNSWLQLISNNPWGMTILLSPKTVDLEKNKPVDTTKTPNTTKPIPKSRTPFPQCRDQSLPWLFGCSSQGLHCKHWCQLPRKVSLEWHCNCG